MNNQRLLSTLSIGFNDPMFDQLYIKIKDTPIVPCEGEGIRLLWEYYVPDQAVVDLLEEFENDGRFIVHLIGREFTDNEIITHISLFDEMTYQRSYGKNKP